MKNRLVFLKNRFREDKFFGVYPGCAACFFFALFKAISGALFGSPLFAVYALYYLCLGLMRLRLIFAWRKNGGYEYEMKCRRQTAKLLLLLNIPMGGVMFFIVTGDVYSPYPGNLIYAAATYTFYTATVAFIGAVKYKKVGSPILSTAKDLNIVSALMSVLGLQNALISRFAENAEDYRRMMNGLTGAGVWLAVIVLSFIMSAKGEKHE